MKKLITLSFVMLFLFGCIDVFAYDIPHEFWSIDDQYQAAVSANDSYAVIETAKEEIELMKNEPENETVLQIIGSRMEMIADTYEALGNYPAAADYYEQYVYYADALHWDDAAKIARAKTLHYRPRLEMFQQTTHEEVFFNAKNEPHMGVFFGATADGEIRQQLSDESAILLFHEFGDTDFTWFHHIFQQAEQKKIRIVFALNVPNEGSDIRMVPSSGEYVDLVISELAKHPTVPVYLRFAAEMNIWDNRATPSEYINAFRFIGNKVHAKLPNVAMVWSVNQMSSWDVNMHDFYPGDEYVDWIGVGSYLSKYFLGRDDWKPEEAFNETVFFAGDSADAVLALEDIVNTYGDRKPIMLSESGVAHYIHSLNRDETKWAINHLHQQYEFLPKVYPQIKAIMYFDKRIPEEVNDYALSDNPELAKEYLEEIHHSYFIHGSQSNAPTAFHKITDSVSVTENTFTFGVYPHVYKNASPKVDVYFDGYYITSLVEPHYLATLDVSNETAGKHQLKLVIDGVIEREYQLDVIKPIRLYLNENELHSDVAPVIVDGRTLVPVRIISENLKAKVDWNAEAREVTVSKDGTNIVLGIDYPFVTVNGETEAIDVAPQIIDNRTMVPIRFLSEKFNLEVLWDDVTRSIHLNQ
ncbi:MAG: hypothetical protein IJ278_05080 [Clostridia bacterium]|nr:hypothetical protein [Clostridia bacterium]